GRIPAAAPVRRIPRWRIGLRVAAAVAALSLAGGVLWMSRKGRTKEQHITAQTAQPVTTPHPWTISSNAGLENKKVHLSDGSEVTLAAHAAIRYRTAPEKD